MASSGTTSGSPAVARPMEAAEWGMMLVLSVLWGGSFFFVGVAVKILPPFTIVALRVSLAAAALLLVIRIAGLSMPRTGRVWRAFFGMGLLNNVIPFCLIVWGQTQIASGLAAILNATTPLFGVLVAHALTRDEKLSGNRLAGVLCGFAGVVVMIGPAVFGGQASSVPGQCAVLAAALSYACAGVFGRRFQAMGIPPMTTAAGQVTASAVMLVPVALAADLPWTLAMPGTDTWAAIGGLALLSTALAYILFFRILATAGATNILLVTFLIPASAILLGALVLGERLAVQHGAGMALIAAGLACIDGRPLRFGKRLLRGA